MGTEPPARERSSQLPLRPGEPPDDLGVGDLALRDAGLVRHDEAEVVARALAAERRGHVGHEHGMPGRVDHRPVVPGAGKRAAPVDEQGALRG